MIGRAVSATTLAIALATPALAAAAESSSADTLFVEGKQLRGQGKIQEACSTFARSQKLAQGVGVTLYLADCYQRLGRTASAWTEFAIAEQLARQQNDPRAAVARTRRQALDSKLDRLTIESAPASAPSGLQVRLDGQIVPTDALNVALPVDPGDHVVEVRAEGAPPRTMTAHVGDDNPTVVVHADVGPVNAPPSAASTEADALFVDGKRLKSEGKIAEACGQFARSQKLEQGVGITLYLADCYERMGRTASAWTEFTLAEKLARAHDDKRADVAHTRVLLLDPTLDRLVISIATATVPAGAEIALDGRVVPHDYWNTPIPVDPGDHAVTFGLPGRETKTFPAHLESEASIVTVRIDDTRVSDAEPASAATSNGLSSQAILPSDPDAIRHWTEIGLIAAGAIGVGAGTALLEVKNQSLTNGGSNGTPTEDGRAATGSAIAFAVGGAAIVSAVILYLASPKSQEAATLVTPTPLVGGGGMTLNTRF